MNIFNINIHWARPDLLSLLVIAVSGAGLLQLYRLRKIKRVVSVLTTPSTVKQRLPGYSYAKSLLKPFCFWQVYSFCVLL